MTPAAPPPAPALTAVETVDARFLQSLVGFNARMAALKIIGQFVPRMAGFGLRVVDFSVLSLIHHNPGITSRQLCDALNLLPPNLVGKIGALERRGLVQRRPHPLDGRAQSLLLTAQGQALMQEAEAAASQLEIEASQPLSAAERRTLNRLLQKIHQA
ncbi:MAG: MarR family transcriptional regulator [Burkholderiaceae bacterium]